MDAKSGIGIIKDVKSALRDGFLIKMEYANLSTITVLLIGQMVVVQNVTKGIRYKKEVVFWKKLSKYLIKDVKHGTGTIKNAWNALFVGHLVQQGHVFQLIIIVRALTVLESALRATKVTT